MAQLTIIDVCSFVNRQPIETINLGDNFYSTWCLMEGCTWGIGSWLLLNLNNNTWQCKECYKGGDIKDLISIFGYTIRDLIKIKYLISHGYNIEQIILMNKYLCELFD